MPVNVDCDLDGGMAHLLFHIGQRFAILNQETRKSLPEVMVSNPAQLGGLQAYVKVSFGVVRGIQKSTVTIAKNPFGNLTLPTLQIILSTM
jgi:hypothetical protein